MLVEVKVPMLSESIAEATLLAWHKKQGEFVKRDENLIDIETDKVVLELPAPDSGLLVKIVKGDGASVASEELIATIDTEAQAPAQTAAQSPAAALPSKSAAKPAKEPPAGATVMPAAKKIAAQNQIDTSEIRGSGRDGRITKGDVLGAIQPVKEPAGAPVQAAAPAPSRGPAPAVALSAMGERHEQRVPMSRL
ncbi:MAG: E3 binding domain-containing protein, partial [Proteobacteria bacterium]|nr:E3 binding domain-containing protein [Burkholderiales bacterium]